MGKLLFVITVNCEPFDIKTRSQTKYFDFLETKKRVMSGILDHVKI
jgi:hypothetical protein